MYYVYILQGEGTHYIGYTGDIEKRLEQYLEGSTITTRKMKNLKLLGYFIKETKTEAIKLERIIKKNGHIEHWKNHETFNKE